ncbi:unnamed protein product [Peniophora sp. CBMAI 1063]|nr:unnamed protein product [Peniophora sp. CBMAI 1063]
MLQDHMVLYFLVAILLACTVVVRYRKSPWRRLPPGPRGLPLLGNILQFKDGKWLLFSAWRKLYGDMIYLNAAGQPVIVLNNHIIATELLDRRAGNYTDRPRNIAGSEIMSGGLFFAFGRYTEVWRRMRKATHEAVNKVVVHGLNDYLASDALVLARSILQDAPSWEDQLHRASASSMLSCLYGEAPLESENDSRITLINEFMANLTRAFAPGAHWVEMMPWLRYVPSRFASWKRRAEQVNRDANGEFIRMFERAQDSISEGDKQGSFCAVLAQQADRYKLNTRESAWCAATMFAGGAHTTATMMVWWVLAMLVSPESQQRAQRELDSIVGRSRVPTFADIPQLPYICAMVKEVLRWGAVMPLGLPHRCMEDDMYGGYFIPKGSIIIANVWEMNRDPEVFGRDCDRFNPARYLDEKDQGLLDPPGTKDDGHFTYGFGRRVCVGKHVANNSLFIEIATCLWAFSFTNVDGQTIDVNAFRDEGVVVHPEPFQLDIKPRFPEALALLSEECELRSR